MQGSNEFGRGARSLPTKAAISHQIGRYCHFPPNSVQRRFAVRALSESGQLLVLAVSYAVRSVHNASEFAPCCSTALRRAKNSSSLVIRPLRITRCTTLEERARTSVSVGKPFSESSLSHFATSIVSQPLVNSTTSSIAMAKPLRPLAGDFEAVRSSTASGSVSGVSRSDGKTLRTMYPSQDRIRSYSAVSIRIGAC